MSRLAQELSLRNERIVVVAPRVNGSSHYDDAQAYRVFRYFSAGRVASFVAMTGALLWVRITARDRATLASMWFPGGLAACLLPRAIRGRLGVLAHGTEIAPGRGGVRRRLMRYVFGKADVIIANSEFTRGLLLQAGVRDAISVVHPGIDAMPIVPARSSVPTIVSVGRLVARKGFDTVLAALPNVIARIPGVVYEIVGSGPQRGELEAIVKRTGIGDHVRFLGAVSDEQMRDAYARAWCFALPARAIGSDVEGFGLVYLEAALAELPAVGGLGSGAEDAIAHGETGLLVDGRSSDAVADALIALLSKPEEAAAMGVKGRDRALAQFTWQRAAAQVSALLNARA